MASSTPAVTPVGRGTQRSRQRTRHVGAGYMFVAPFFIVFVAMLIVPLAYAAYLSLYRDRLIGGVSFVGLDNYIEALGDERFRGGLVRMLVFLVVQVPIMLGLALFLALALDSGKVIGAKTLRLTYFVPYAVPGVVATLMWGYLYGPDFGPIAQLFREGGLGAPSLLDSGTILWSMMNIVTWEFTGYNMIIMYAALRSIPTDLYEAAAMDGAGALRVAWSIKIPAIRPAIMLTFIFSVIGTFQLFNEPSLLDAISPNAITNGYTPNFYAYNLAFVNQNVNYAAAIAFLLGLVIAVVSYAVQVGSQVGARRHGGGTR